MLSLEAPVVTAALVGRTGASGARVEEGLSSSPRQEAPVAQVRPFMQQPPPREAGHENQPVEQVYAEREVEVDVGSGVVLVVDDVVGMAAAVVEVEVADGVDEEVEGWTKDVDVPSAMPIQISLLNPINLLTKEDAATYIQYPDT